MAFGWRRKVGDDGEDRAVRFLKRQGFRIVARQVQTPYGEIDIIGLDGETLVFVEVKTRRSTAAGLAVDAVTAGKQQAMLRSAVHFLKGKKWLGRPTRFDVVAVQFGDTGDEPTISHFRSAFEPSDSGQFFV